MPELASYFPDEAASKAMLGNLNLGGWVDFIWHFKTDASEPASSNTGWCDTYMRQQDPITKIDGAWLHLLDMQPIQFTYDSVLIEKGIGTHGAAYTSFTQAIYNRFDRVWGGANSARAYYDNTKIGDANTTFEQMTPDGSSL